MPFHEVTKLDQRRELARLANIPGANRSALARAFGVDRKTVAKWAERAAALGEAGLCERSRRPRASPARATPELEGAVLALRAAHPAWGGRKLHHALARTHASAPAPSTITEILRRNGVELGLLGGGQKPFIRFEREAPNELWQMDFKGHVALAGQGRLHPLTVLDDHSRFCLVLAACADERTDTVKTHLQRAFRAHGLPHAIISDNGSPWGDGPGSPFTPLGVWLIEHGVRIAHSRPYHPQTMGKDERFHRTLDLEVLKAQTFDAIGDAARAFARWRGVYNGERPHQAIGYAVPADRYRPSARAYRERVEPFCYQREDLLVRVIEGGRIRAFGRQFRAPKAFRGKHVAIRPADEDGLYAVFFRHVEIARFDRATGKRHPPNLSTLSQNAWP